jgi:hypothetical protein
MLGSILRLTILALGWYFIFPIVAHSATCNVTFGFANSGIEPVGGLLVDVGYENAGAAPVGDGGSVECNTLIQGGLGTFNNLSGQKVVKAGFVHVSGFSGSSLFRCTFDGEPVGSDSFGIETVDASTPDLERIVPAPAIVVSSVDCDGAGGDCQEPGDPSCPWCGDGSVNQWTEQCDEGAANDDADPEACRGDCSWADVCGDADGSGAITVTDARIVLQKAIGLAATCPRSRCDVNGSSTLTATDARAVLHASVGIPMELDCWKTVVFRFDNEASLAGLQFVVSYGETGSTFVGSGEEVFCTEAEGTLASFNNDVEAHELHVAIIAASGIATPAPVAACSFYQTEEGPTPGDFVIDVTDATTTSLGSIPEPSVSVLLD